VDLELVPPPAKPTGEGASGCSVLQKKILRYHQLLQERAKQQRRAV
jgi:hypothetical protein